MFENVNITHTLEGGGTSDCKRRSTLYPLTISRTSRWNGSLRRSKSVDFWYWRISLSATVPLGCHILLVKKESVCTTWPEPVGLLHAAGRLRGLAGWKPPVILQQSLYSITPALVASCLRGALPPVDLRAVCLVRAMV